MDTYIYDLIEGTSWSYAVNGVAKKTYINADAKTTNIKIDRPILPDAQTVIINVFDAVRSNKYRTRGTKYNEYIGKFQVWGRTKALVDTALPLLDTIADGDTNVLFHINGTKYMADGQYLSEILYQVTILE